MLTHHLWNVPTYRHPGHFGRLRSQAVNRNLACKSTKLPRESEGSGEGNERVQDALVEILDVSIESQKWSQTLNKRADEEREKLVQAAEEISSEILDLQEANNARSNAAFDATLADIDQQFQQVEAELKEVRADMQADAEDFDNFQRKVIKDMSRGMFFGELYADKELDAKERKQRGQSTALPPASAQQATSTPPTSDQQASSTPPTSDQQAASKPPTSDQQGASKPSPSPQQPPSKPPSPQQASSKPAASPQQTTSAASDVSDDAPTPSQPSASTENDIKTTTSFSTPIATRDSTQVSTSDEDTSHAADRPQLRRSDAFRKMEMKVEAERAQMQARNETRTPSRVALFAALTAILVAACAADLASSEPSWGQVMIYGFLAICLASTALYEQQLLNEEAETLQSSEVRGLDADDK